jgi:hypothetical protein
VARASDSASSDSPWYLASAEDAQIMVLRDIGFGMERGEDEDIRVLIEVLLGMRRWRSGVNGHGSRLIVGVVQARV